MSIMSPRRHVLGYLGGAGLLSIAAPALALRPLPRTVAEAARAMMLSSDVPAIGLGVIKAGRVQSVEAFGFADRERQIPATPDTAFLLSSISKVVTGAALMQLWERHLFDLDSPIAPHLDFTVENPFHEEPITFRQLLTHTSSISDLNYTGFEVDGDPTLSLRDFLTGYLSPVGRWYAPDKSYLNAAPGERWSYSNVASALAGYLCERLTGASLKLQTADRIFRPLKMNPSAWSVAELGGKTLVATPYVGSSGQLKPRPPLGYPDWPAGLLRSSPTAMAHFLAAHAAGGQLGGTRILGPTTVQAMIDLKPFPRPDGMTQLQGLFWEPLGEGFVGKRGGDPGSSTLMGFNPATGDGAVVLTNRSSSRDLGLGMRQLIRVAAASNS